VEIGSFKVKVLREGLSLAK